MSPQRFLSFLAVFTSLLAIGCNNGGGATVTAAEASKAAQTVAGGITLVMNQSSFWTNTGGSNFTYSAADLSMNGTHTNVSGTTTDNLTITLSGYTDAATAYSVSGTIYFSGTSNGVTASGTISGNLSLSGGPVTTGSWNVDYTATMSGPSYTGTVTANGTTFDASTLSINATGDANAVTMSLFSNGIRNIMNNEGNWTNTGGNNWTHSGGAGLSMSGTVSGSNPTVYSLTFTFTNHYDNGYTENGVLVLTANVYASSSNGTVTSTGNLTFAGGNVTLQTWDLGWTTAAALTWFPRVPTTWTGTLASNGTNFDPKTLYF
jgi:hypothetical protein